MSARPIDALKAGLQLLADSWLIVGLSLVLLVALESAYRAQGAVRRALWSSPARTTPAAHPHDGEAWWEELHRARQEVLYDPYRSWWPGPVSGGVLNVDSAGRRRTVASVTPPPDARRVLMLGGSTMWGYTARDSFTIPSLTARELYARDVRDAELVNLAQSAYTATQGLITLMLELRRGVVPYAVVFLDGNNEVATAFESGVAGRTFGEQRAARRMKLGGRTALGEVLGLGRHLELVQRMNEWLDGAPAGSGPAAPSPEAVCPDVAAQYVEVVTMAALLGREYGFRTIFLWQPLRATTRKPLTEWERAVHSWRGYREMLQICTEQVDSLMADRTEVEFHQLAGLFDGDTSDVFLDEYGHITESANAVIARRIADLLMQESPNR